MEKEVNALRQFAEITPEHWSNIKSLQTHFNVPDTEKIVIKNALCLINCVEKTNLRAPYQSPKPIISRLGAHRKLNKKIYCVN